MDGDRSTVPSPISWKGTTTKWSSSKTSVRCMENLSNFDRSFLPCSYGKKVHIMYENHVLIITLRRKGLEAKKKYVKVPSVRNPRNLSICSFNYCKVSKCKRKTQKALLSQWDSLISLNEQ